MDFWEQSEQQAIENIRGDKRTGRPGPLKRKWILRGIRAHAQALKEMVVGQPITGVIEHEMHWDSTKVDPEEWTQITQHPVTISGYAECGFPGHHAIDGEEVAVLVIGIGNE